MSAEWTTLEYQKVLAQLADCAGSVMGKELARSLTPAGDFEAVAARLAETDEAVRVFSLGAALPVNAMRDVREPLRRAAQGALLDVNELIDLIGSLGAMRATKRYFKELELDVPTLKARAHVIELLGQLEADLARVVDEHGNVSENASAELRRIRNGLRLTKQRIKDTLDRLLHNGEYDKIFQERLITVREERYVVPVKAEYRHALPGLVHGQSATGATLYIEPLPLVNLNNEQRELALAEEREITRILRDISAKVGRQCDTLLANLDLLASMDLAFAKARLAQAQRATRPQLNREGRTRLCGARHPLLPADRVVPIDVDLRDVRMLVITGSNTGGKTVCLKTAGLLALMAQSGLYVPCEAGTELAVYGHVFADIGDEQSIEQSLSTFSAHMRHIVAILSAATAGDLVLLDELGAGTDPDEGAALAIAILERLRALGATTLATTHYGQLKSFAYTQEGIENASVEFDLATLRPTYRLLQGIPGGSNAFAIGQRLGLDSALIDRARVLVREGHGELESVVSGLQQSRREYEQRTSALTAKERQVSELEAKLADEVARRGELRQQARNEAHALVRRARLEAEAIIKELKEQYRDHGAVARQSAYQAARQQLATMGDEMLASDTVADSGPALASADVKIGDLVEVVAFGQCGEVSDIKGEMLNVQLGQLSMRVRASGCRKVGRRQAKAMSGDSVAPPRSRPNALLARAAAAHRDVDIRGLMVDEGTAVVGKFLDDASVAGLKTVLVIHGKGTGALRSGIHEYLKHHPSVKAFRLADIDEGGAGATEVTLK